MVAPCCGRRSKKVLRRRDRFPRSHSQLLSRLHVSNDGGADGHSTKSGETVDSLPARDGKHPIDPRNTSTNWMSKGPRSRSSQELDRFNIFVTTFTGVWLKPSTTSSFF